MGSNLKHSSVRQGGFSLIEIMVGLVIGLLATLVIMQVFSVFEGQKRTTTGIADAQTNGSIALYSIARELQMAGFGLLPGTDSPLECTALNIDANTGFDPASGPLALAPVSIADGGAGSDSITIHYSSSQMGGLFSPIMDTGTVNVTLAPNDVMANTNLGCQVDDIALIIKGTACALSKVTELSAASATPPAKIRLITNPLPAEAVNEANLACLGTWNEITYRVNGGNLERSAVPSIADIVNIQAQYGITLTSASNQIIQWVDATGATWAAPTVADRQLIRAIRIAVVARNGLLEKEDVSVECTDLTSDQPTGVCAWSGTSSGTIPISPAPKVTLSNYPNWQRYRYRVFETIVPLRNMIWAAKETLL